MSETETKELDYVVVRFAGDSGDGMQLTGTQFTNTSALAGNSLATLPDFPAEIRAPQGTIPGVSGFQIQFGEVPIHTPGDEPDVLVAMNPAALKANIDGLRSRATLIVNQDAFTDNGLKKAGYASNPLEDGSLDGYKVFALPITQLTRNALQEVDLDARSKDRCKNMFALGLTYWMYSRPLEATETWIESKFKGKDVLIEANRKALHAGYNCGAATESIPNYQVKSAPIEPGTYRNITGNVATVLGLIAARQASGRELFLGSYPITPASDLLHELSKYKEFGIMTFQAEDEIAAVTSSLGASFGGSLAVTSTSGPGLDLKAESIGLACKVELPLVIIDVQRAGPSTGMPTKTEQSDLLQAFFGRHGESPLAILAPANPSECFHMAYWACKLALEHMTPVILLSDGYLANGAEPWKLPSLDTLETISTRIVSDKDYHGSEFLPYERDANQVRPWALPGTPGFEHRLSGIESAERTGNISYSPDNHQRMTDIRADKIAKIAGFIPPLDIEGDREAELLVLGWGSTYGSIKAAVEGARKEGLKVAQAHLRFLSPFPANLREVLESYDKVLVPEINSGQLAMLLQGKFCRQVQSLPKVQGQPFKVREIKEALGVQV